MASAFLRASARMPLEVDDLGTPELKNIAAKVQVFRVRLGTPERPGLPLPDKPSIAVLAFTNMSGDAEQEYFSHGIADDIEQLFDWYNCSGCHFHGGGGMGPALMDQQ